MRLGEQPRPQQQQQVPKVPQQQQQQQQQQAAPNGDGAAPTPLPSEDPDRRFIADVDASCNPTLHAGYAGGSLGWGMNFKVASAKECCEACKAHARTCGSADSKGKVYYTRTWEGKTTEERCPATMSSNELGTHPAERCNVFVYCPTPIAEGGLCWSNDVWNHTYGEVSVHEANARRPTVRPCARLFPSPSPCFQSTTTPIASSSSSEADRRRRALTPMSLARLRSQCWLKNQANPARPWAGAYGGYPAGYRKKHRTTPPLVQWMSGSLTDQPVRIDGPHWHW